MNGHADPHANVPATCRHGEPGCVGPSGFDEEYHGRPLYICPACVSDATAAEHGSGRCTGMTGDTEGEC